MNLEKLQSNITGQIVSDIGKLFSEISELTDLKVVKEKELVDIGYLYTEVTKELSLAKEEAKAVRVGLSMEKSSVEAEKQSLKTMKRDVKAEHSRLTKEINSLCEQVENKQVELKEVSEEIRKITPLKIVKESLENDIEKLKTHHTKQQGEHDELKRLHSDEVKKINVEIRERKDELKTINKEISDRGRIVLPRIADLEERENKIATKEEGLRIVEARYKKLYKDEGANFKI